MHRYISTFWARLGALGVLVAIVLAAGGLPSQEEEGGSPLDTEKGRGANPEGWDAYMEIVEAKHVSAEKEGDPSVVELKFSIVPEVPKGATIVFSLDFGGLPVEQMEYKVTDKRKDIAVQWKPKTKLAPGDYFLRTSLPLEKQAGPVKDAIQRNGKRFPMQFEPWYYLWMRDELAISVSGLGGKAEGLCDAYVAFLDELIQNMNEFMDKMDAVKEGKELVTGGKLDATKLKDFVLAWQKKQAETQKKIVGFQQAEPSLFLQSQTAFAYLLDLARMVSKRAMDAFAEVNKQYRESIKLPRDPQGFDRRFRLPVTVEGLQQRYERIMELVCPEEVEEAPPPEEGAPAEGGGEAEGGSEEPKEGDTPPAEK